MSRFLAALMMFGRGEEGASLTEYALFFALITVVCIGAITIIGSKISSFFQVAASSI